MKLRLAVLCLLAVLLAPAGALAHVHPRAPIIHEIDHVRRDTNALRRDSGLEAIPTTFHYRRVADRDYRLAVLERWKTRFDRTWRRSVWVRLAECESNGDWRIDGAFDGGLQFHPGTWNAYRPAGFPRFAHGASRLEQVRVARRVLAAEGWNAWPACSALLGLR